MSEVLDENQIDKRNKIRFSWTAFFVYFALLLIGLIFWGMHWPGGGFFTILGTGSVFGYCASNLIVFRLDHKLNLVFTILSGCWFFLILLGSIIYNNPFVMVGVWLLLITFTIVFIPHLLYKTYQVRKNNASKLK